jgi:hypothetical protein
MMLEHARYIDKAADRIEAPESAAGHGRLAA